MKEYMVSIDGYKVGIVELTIEEVREMSKDSGIIITEIGGR